MAARTKDQQRRKHLRRNFNLTPEEYSDLLEDQFGRCAVCFREPSPNRALAVDHNHATDEIRGLLCTKCNVALGLLDDSEERIESLLEYLQRRR